MRSLRWKLILMAVILVFIPVYLLNRYAIIFFDLYTRTAFEKNMHHYAYIVGEQYKLGLDESRSEAEQEEFDEERLRLFKRMGKEVDARICLLNKDGSLIFDSESGMKDHSSIRERREVTEALKGAYSTKSRLSEDRLFMYYYIALPIKDDEKNMLGVAYVVAHTNPIVLAINRMVANQRLATYIALACAGLVALILALTMTRRLRSLMRETRSFAAGRKPLGKPPRGGDEIAALGRSIHSMADEMESRNSYNREFIQTTLHELKTPLTAIRGAAEVLESLGPESESVVSQQSGDIDSERVRRKFLGKIDFQVERLMQLVGELRELTCVDVESSQVEREEVEYCQFIKDVIGRLEDTFTKPHAQLIVNVPDVELRVNIVPGRIEQVLANLLDNAFRYTQDSGEVTINVEKGDCVRTIVKDTGCGISETNINRVFDRFFTTERSQQPSDYGSGLGLAIATSIMRSHQGTISVESTVGNGTRFMFEIPRL